MSLPARIRESIRQKPSRLVLALAIALAVVDISLAATFLRTRSDTEAMAAEVLALQGSLEQLQRVEQEGLVGLEAQALAEESRLAQLQAGFPTLGEPFDLFRRGFTLARLNHVELEGIERGDSTVLETPVGQLATTAYRLSAAGDLPACLSFVRDLELAGLTTLAVDQLSLAPADLRCDFSVVLASAAPGVEGSDG